MTERLARACASRPWRVLSGWVLAVVVSVMVIATFLGDALTNQAEVATQTDSKRADELLAEQMRSGSEPTDVVVVRSQTLTAEDPAFQDRVPRLRRGRTCRSRRTATPSWFPCPCALMTSSRSSSWPRPPTARAASTSS